MAEWQYFHLEQERPDTNAPDSEKERKVLEMTAAVKIASLLAEYGEIEIVPVTVTNSRNDEVITYEYLRLDPLELIDDGKLKIEQLPTTPNGPITDGGVHLVEVVDKSNIPKCFFTVYDPAVFIDRELIIGPEDERVPLDVLHELLDVLVIVECEISTYRNQNNPRIDTTAYPREYIEPDFAEIIKNF